MKAYKVEILIIDHDDIGPDEIKGLLEDTQYPNHCIFPEVKNIACKDIGEWSDNHPLNLADYSDYEYQRLFRND